MTLALLPDRDRRDIPALKLKRDIASLIRLLNDRHPDVQWQAADALGSLGAEAVVPLIRVLDSRHKVVRIGAIEALASIRDPRSIPSLVWLLQNDQIVEVRWVAALALGEIGDRSAIPPLVLALRSPEQYIRYGAARSLDMLRWEPPDDLERVYYAIALEDWESVKKLGTAATGPLTSMLSDPEAATRAKALGILGEIGDPAGQTACETGLRDKDGSVRWEAVIAAKKCDVRTGHIPWGLSQRRRTGQNPWAAAVLNFLFIGLGYNYLGFWWGFLVFMSYSSLITLAQLETGTVTPFLIAYPITALFAVQTFYIAKKMPDL